MRPPTGPLFSGLRSASLGVYRDLVFVVRRETGSCQSWNKYESGGNAGLTCQHLGERPQFSRGTQNQVRRSTRKSDAPGGKSRKTPYRGQQENAPGSVAGVGSRGDGGGILMEQQQGGIDGSKSVRDMHHLRLMSLLQEQVRDHGRKRAAEILGVDRRTLDAAVDQGMLTRRIRGALERALQSGVGSAAAQQRDRNDKLEDRLGDLEGLVEEQGKEMREGRRAAEEEMRKLREEQAQGLRKIERAVAGLNAAGGDRERAAESSGPQPAKQADLRREHPELVTLEPSDDDQEVFGAAWELVGEWRELKETHPNEGKDLEWLLTEEKFLSVELALLEEHGLTLPPALFPLRGFDRSGQVNWRRKALDDTRRKISRRKLLAWARHVLTLERWRR